VAYVACFGGIVGNLVVSVIFLFWVGDVVDGIFCSP
jgi:hypothetical protein